MAREVGGVFAEAAVMVTGGAGFIGSWLCERLLDAGARVHCIDSLLTGRRQNVEHLIDRPGFTFSQADVTTVVPVHECLQFVFHLASPASPRRYQRMPVQTLLAGSAGTHRALDVACRHDARFVFASAAEVYGDPETHPQPEAYRGRVNPVGPRSVYDEAKRFGEALTDAYRRCHRTRTAIARIFNTYGPRMDLHDGRVVPTLLRQAAAGEPLIVFGDGSQTRSLCWVGDTVEGLLRLAVSAEHEPVNIGSDEESTIGDLAVLMRDLTGSGSDISYVDFPMDEQVVRRPDLTRARERLGWSPRVSLREGLNMTLASMADAPGAPRGGYRAAQPQRVGDDLTPTRGGS